MGSPTARVNYQCCGRPSAPAQSQISRESWTPWNRGFVLESGRIDVWIGKDKTRLCLQSSALEVCQVQDYAYQCTDTQPVSPLTAPSGPVKPAAVSAAISTSIWTSLSPTPGSPWKRGPSSHGATVRTAEDGVRGSGMDFCRKEQDPHEPPVSGG